MRIRSLFVVCTLLVVTGRLSAQDPFATGPVNSPIPALSATGLLFDPPIQYTGVFFAHEGRFTWGPDIVSPQGTFNLSSWNNSIFVPHTVAPVLLPHLQGAETKAKDGLGTLDAGSLADAFELFELFGGNVSISPAKETFFGYEPLRARWLRSQWGRASGLPLWVPETNYTYAEPFAFGEIRKRGARLYCASRRARFEQGSDVLQMGKQALFSVNVLGQQIDFLSVESTFLLGGPERFLGAADAPGAGSRAFYVPLLFGNTVSLVDGIGLPSFGEIRVPAGLVTADSEVSTLASRRPILKGYAFQCNGGWPFCTIVPLSSFEHSKDYQTVSHADGLFAASRKMDFHHEQPLFSIGLVTFYLTLDVNYEVGTFSLADSRVLDVNLLPLSFPQSTRTGMLFANPLTGVRYHDGAWRLGQVRGSQFLHWEASPDGASDPFWRSALFAIPQPHDVRAVTDDDHAFESRNALTIGALLSAELGGGWGPFELSLSVSGGLNGSTAQRFVVRDALMAQDPTTLPTMRPATALSIRPAAEAQAKLVGPAAKLRFVLDLGFFGEIDFEKQLFKVPDQTLAQYNTEDSLETFDEDLFFRLGYGSRDGNAMTQPTVLSHLPQRIDFNTFSSDVAACLADETPNPNLPPPCPPKLDPSEPPRAELCVYGPTLSLQEQWDGLLPGHVCTDVAGYVADLVLGEPQMACVSDYLGYLCSPVSKTQAWQGVNVVSHVVDLGDPGAGDELAGILQACAAAFVAPGDSAGAQAILEELVSVSACRADATLIDGDQIFSAIDPFNPPPVQKGKACTQ